VNSKTVIPKKTNKKEKVVVCPTIDRTEIENSRKHNFNYQLKLSGRINGVSKARHII
jgi:hypothetical protein